MSFNSVRPWMVVALVLLVYLGLIFFTNDHDPKTFVSIGSCFSQCTGEDGENCDVPDDATLEEQFEIEGYDGQFNYYIARDPDNAAPCIDVPAYRYQRILLPFLGYLLSMGTEEAVPWTFVVVNALALILSTRLLEALLETEGRKRWFALSYGLFFGLVISVRLSTSEPLAYGLVLVGIWAYQRQYLWLMTVALGLAGLAKETTGIMTAGFVLYFALNRRWQEVARLVLLAGLPFFLWQLYLYDWFGETGMGSGGAKATSFEIIPFLGVIKIGTEGGIAAFLLLGVLLVGIPVVLPTLWGLRESWKDFRQRKISLYTCLLLTSAVIMPFVPFSTYREFLGIFRFIPGLVMMVVLYSAERNLRRPLMYSTLWIVLLMFLTVG
ncbi:MAG: hypothetical protein KJ064_11870 [Anaerolineae bacterium]|nr:hypothetical protein [Anaerolineae bacterium]